MPQGDAEPIRLDLLGPLALTGTPSGGTDRVLHQPKRLGLLVYLALGRQWHQRDALLALFWPESDEAHARNALSVALSFLRSQLGDGVIATRGLNEVGLAADRVVTDVELFDRALRACRHEDALGHYRGDLLASFHLGDAPEFGRWLDGERTALRERAVRAALELADERHAIWASNLGETYMLLSRFREAERILGQAIELSRDWAEPHVWRIALYLKWPGHLAQARAAVEEGMLSTAVAVDQDFVYWALLVSMVERKYDQALARLAAMTAEAFDGRNHYVPRAQVQSTIYGLMNRPAQAAAYADSALALAERAVRRDSTDARLHSALGLALASVGRKDDAIREGQRGVALTPIARDAYRGTFRLEDLALIFAGVGEPDRAIDQLQVLLDMPSLLSRDRLRLDPRWEPLRGSRRFQQLVSTR